MRPLCPYNWQDAPPVPGVYMLFRGDVCIYVGSTINLQVRLKGHPNRFLADRCNWVECREPRLAETEQAWIDILKPKMNRARASRCPNIAVARLAQRLRKVWWEKRGPVRSHDVTILEEIGRVQIARREITAFYATASGSASPSPEVTA